MANGKWDFINNEILNSSIFGGLTRGCPIYNKKAKEVDKNKLRNLLREKLKEYSKDYLKVVSNEQHIKNIKNFSDEISKKFGEFLVNGRFRFGRAQKLINLYLKYLWTLNKIPQPPHCPFDRIIISKLGLNIAWTKFDSEKDYEKIVKKAAEEAKAENVSISEWELKSWNKL